MLFDFDLTIPAATPANAPAIAKARLTYGTLSQVRVVFPPGPATLVHVVVRDRLFQVVPANPEGSLNFDDNFILSTMEYDIRDAPFELDMIGWSPDAVFDHIITFQFDMQPKAGQSWNKFVDALFNSSRQRPGGR